MTLEFSWSAMCTTAVLWCTETVDIIQYMTPEIIYISPWSGPVWAFYISLYFILPQFSLSVKCELAFTVFCQTLPYYLRFFRQFNVKAKILGLPFTSVLPTERKEHISRVRKKGRETWQRTFCQVILPYFLQTLSNPTEINHDRLQI